MENEEFKAGDKVEIVEGLGVIFSEGAKARLTEVDSDGDWWANFRDCGNEDGSFDDGIDGIWCIGRPGEHFKAAE